MFKSRCARALAEWHFKASSDLVAVYEIHTPQDPDPDHPVMIVEVVNNIPTVASYGRNYVSPIDTVIRSPTNESRKLIDVRVVELCPEDLERVKAGTLKLVAGWDLASATMYVRSDFDSEE